MALTYSTYHRAREIKVRRRLAPLDPYAEWAHHTTLGFGCASHSELGGVHKNPQKVTQWKKREKRMRVVGVFLKDICTVSAWFCARTGSLTIGFEWGGLAVCQTLRTGCFVFKVTKFGVTFLFCFLAQLLKCCKSPIDHARLYLVHSMTSRRDGYVL